MVMQLLMEIVRVNNDMSILVESGKMRTWQ